MHRYYVFASRDFEASTGMYDCIARVGDRDEAIRLAKESDGDLCCVHVWDVVAEQFVLEEPNEYNLFRGVGKPKIFTEYPESER